MSCSHMPPVGHRKMTPSWCRNSVLENTNRVELVNVINVCHNPYMIEHASAHSKLGQGVGF